MRCPQYCAVFVLSLRSFSLFEVANPLIIMFVDFCFLTHVILEEERRQILQREREVIFEEGVPKEIFCSPHFL